MFSPFQVCVFLTSITTSWADEGVQADQFYLEYLGRTVTSVAYFQLETRVDLAAMAENLRMCQDLSDRAKEHFNATGKSSAENTNIILNRLWNKLNTTMSVVVAQADVNDADEQALGRRRRSTWHEELWARSVNDTHYHSDHDEGVHAAYTEFNLGDGDRIFNGTHFYESKSGHIRHKRLAGLLIGVALKVVSTIWGIYKDDQLAKIQKRMQLQEGRTEDLYLISRNLDLALGREATRIDELELMHARSAEQFANFRHDLDFHNNLWGKLATMESFIDRAATVLDFVLRGQISHQAMVNDAMTNLLPRVVTDAKKLGYKVLVNNQAEVFQCRASMRGIEGGFAVYVHIPLAQINDDMSLYGHLEIPIQMEDGMHLFVSPKKDVIATASGNQYFRTMNRADLTACYKLGQLHTCDNGNLRTLAEIVDVYAGQKDDDLCMYFILTQQYEKVIASCPFQIREPVDKGFQISATMFVFSSKKAHAGTITCPGDKPPATFQVNGVTKVRVDPGCEIATPYFQGFGRDNTIQTEAHQSWSWPRDLDLSLLLQGLNTSYVREMRTLGVPDIPTDLEELKRFTRNRRLGTGISGATATTVELQQQLQDHARAIDALQAELRTVSATSFTTVALAGIYLAAGTAATWFIYTRRRTIKRQIRENSHGAILKVLDWLEARGYNAGPIREAIRLHVFHQEGHAEAQALAVRVATEEAAAEEGRG